jgi:hypothetical protein
MVVYRMAGLAIVALALAACQSPLPVPDYVSIKQPAPYRSGANGMNIDNEDYAMDAQGYRVDNTGQRAGEVDMRAKMGDEPSNAMAGFYVSSTGTYAPGRVMTPSEGATAGPGFGPGSAGMTPAASDTTPPATLPPTTPPSSGTPVPLTPQTR